MTMHTISRQIAFWAGLFILIITLSCSRNPESKTMTTEQFAIRDFNPMTNWRVDTTGMERADADGKRILYLDYMAPRESGFLIPSLRQTEDGRFQMEFYIKNTTQTNRKFAYKIYYQNESYKFPEQDPSDTTRQHPLAWENFYGSWEDMQKRFALTGEIPADGEFHKVTDRFRIVGNPRDEQRYYSEGKNDRWKRNPRTGDYSFLLVVTMPELVDSNGIPPYIQDISLMHDSTFVSPYFYFLYGNGSTLSNTLKNIYPSSLKVVAKPDPGAGVYVSPWFYPADKYGNYFTSTCGNSDEIYKQAAFEQFVHYIDPTTKYANIPVVADVLNDNYSLQDYNWNKQFYRKEELVAVMASTTKRPCETVISDPEQHKITIKNPATGFGKWEKQNVGVITRHGLTYGKWTVKAKLTELINKHGLWNGLTNAIWLITQDQSPWNYRRDCNNSGYFAHYYGGDTDERVKNIGYSEIDFEILKTVEYCPGYILPPAYNKGLVDQYNVDNWNIPLPEEVEQMSDKILVACTNWDMACNDPVNYRGGCNPIVYNDQVFWQHKWGETYRAITSKMPELDDELFGSDYYYFQIDWQPERIIWRIGPEKDQLRVVGYVDNTITSIPNNQMLLIITQEFHNTRWWVGSMFDQANVPFPKNDIIGEIFEVTIE
ncbi:MAG: hypothetical protein IH596_12545 [Bacteroidales bacterium]|nr:hypothetical protein [Bacteroidales bacterium]